MADEKCLVGRLVDTKCDSHLFSKEDVIDFTSLCPEDIKNLKYRIDNFPAEPSGYICALHKHTFLTNYTNVHKNCCNPFNQHSKRQGLKIIKLEVCESMYNNFNIRAPSGQKLCLSCYTKVTNLIADFEKKRAINNQQEADSQVVLDPTADNLNNSDNILEMKSTSGTQNSSTTENNPSSSESSLGFVTESQEQIARVQGLKRVLDSVELSMPKRQKLSDNRLLKVSENLAESIYKQSIVKINSAFQTNLNINKIKELKEDSDALAQIMSNIIESYNKQTTVSGKIKILTILPPKYSYIDIKKYVDCTRYMVRQAHEVRRKYGVLADPPRKKICHYSEDLLDSIENYYRDDKNSQPCAGAKERVVVVDRKTKKKETMTKRYLLYTLKELYQNWIDDHLDDLTKVPGFSLFASLRPDDCFLAGAPGTHTVCLCMKHENPKLKVRQVSNSLNYRVLLDACVCSVDDEDCMMGNCADCPGAAGIRELLANKNLIKTTGCVIYYAWETVNTSNSKDEMHSGTRVTLMQKVENVDDFYEGLILDILELKKHHYISETQKYCYTYMRDNLDYDTGLMDMDFSENYTFIAQNSVQAFYFNNTQATLHPFVFYYRSEDGMRIDCASFCVVSDYLKHNAYVVNLFQEKVLEIIKKRFPWVKKLIYFSDGAPTQYKNKNNFTNVCYHEEDFGFCIISYNFFATSHGKGPCDGIGGKGKSMVKKASLRSPPEKQILTPRNMFDFLVENMESTTFIWVDTKDCEERERKLRRRFNAAKTVDNTRQYHYVKPINLTQAKFKITTLSDEYTTEFVSK